MTAAQEGKADYRLQRLAAWLEESQETAVKIQRKKPPTMKPKEVRKGPASSSAASSDNSAMSETLLKMLQSLQEDVQNLKEERPHKRAENRDEDMSSTPSILLHESDQLSTEPADVLLHEACTSIDITSGPLSDHKARQLSFQASEMVPHAFASLVGADRLKLLEVACSPDSVLTETVNREAKSEMSAKRCSLFNGYDLSTSHGVHKVIHEIDTLNPEHVWMSPICGPYSIMQNINQRTEKQCEDLQNKRRDALKQYVGCALIFSYCVQRGIHVAWEWSQSCQAWRLPLMQKLAQRYQPYCGDSWLSGGSQSPKW